jgi:hypothetical protein
MIRSILIEANAIENIGHIVFHELNSNFQSMSIHFVCSIQLGFRIQYAMETDQNKIQSWLLIPGY